jgi:hypothetical protein
MRINLINVGLCSMISKIWKYARKYSALLAGTGLLFLIFAVAAHYLEGLRKFDNELIADEGSATLHQLEFSETAATALMSFHQHFELRFPLEMLENETRTFSLEYDQYTIVTSIPDSSDPVGISPDTSILREQLFKPAKATLTSSGFDVSPNEPIEIQEGTNLPARFLWTIRPKSEGPRHDLLLDISNLLIVPDERTTQLDNELEINGRQIQLDNYEIIPVAITVHTIWGVSRKTYEIVKYSIALLSFILMYPLVHEFLGNNLPWTRGRLARRGPTKRSIGRCGPRR